ncbi:MAG: hypothetical protein P8011_09790 [Acidihalobacter sp.]|uniref:hypothetical protein n=1 Tax=Acidihalobacter sp. TaxID=1872108 RepID=UPI00307F9808
MFRLSIKRTTTHGSAELTGRQMEPYRSVFAQTVNLLGKLGIEVSDITGAMSTKSVPVSTSPPPPTAAATSARTPCCTRSRSAPAIRSGTAPTVVVAPFSTTAPD